MAGICFSKCECLLEISPKNKSLCLVSKIHEIKECQNTGLGQFVYGTACLSELTKSTENLIQGPLCACNCTLVKTISLR